MVEPYLVVLYVVLGEGGEGGVGPHHVVVHHGPAAEQGEAAGTAENTAEDVLGGFLEPVAHRVLKLLVPLHVAATCRHSPTLNILIWKHLICSTIVAKLFLRKGT